MQKAGLMQGKTAGATALEKCEMQARTEGSSKRFRGGDGARDRDRQKRG